MADNLGLDIISVGLWHGMLPPALAAMEHSLDILPLSPREEDDFRAFIAAGWQLRPGTDLNWKNAQDHNGAEKIEPGLVARHPGGGLVILRNRLVLQLNPTLSPARIADFRQRYAQAWPLEFGKNLFEVELKLPEYDLQGAVRQELDFMNANPDVVFCEPSLVYHLTPPGRIMDGSIDSFDQWQWDNIHLEDAWAVAGKGKGIRVAVIDYGFHDDSDILPTAWTAALDKEGNPQETLRPSSHGTFCAGLVGGHLGDLAVNGAAPECDLAFIGVPKEGVMSQVALAKALMLCAKGPSGNNGADVISCSLGWGSKWTLSPELKMAIDCVHEVGRPDGDLNRGAVIVWAVFNSEEEILSSSVEGYDGLLAVAQCNSADARVVSGYGLALDLIAPGYKVRGIRWQGKVRGIGEGEGSSLAAPCVAGVAALVLAANPNLTWRQVAEVLTQSCDRLGKAVPDLPDRYIGWGRLDAKAAVEKAKDLLPVASTAPPALRPVRGRRSNTAKSAKRTGRPRRR